MSNQIVVFQIQKQSYGVDIKDISEIIRMQPITHIPSSPSHVEGITNLRGNLCSIINSRTLLNLVQKEQSEQDKIIVLDGGKAGVIVDEVSEILTVEEEDKRGLGAFEELQSLGFIDYLVQSNERIISVLKLKEMVLTNEEEPVAIEA